MTDLFKLKYFYIILLTFVSLTVISSNKISADQKIKIIADEIFVEQESREVKAAGNAVAETENGSKIKSDFIIYDENDQLINRNCVSVEVRYAAIICNLIMISKI